MEVDEFSMDVSCLPQSAFMVESDLSEAIHGSPIAIVNNGKNTMQVICFESHVCYRVSKSGFDH